MMVDVEKDFNKHSVASWGRRIVGGLSKSGCSVIEPKVGIRYLPHKRLQIDEDNFQFTVTIGFQETNFPSPATSYSPRDQDLIRGVSSEIVFTSNVYYFEAELEVVGHRFRTLISHENSSYPSYLSDKMAIGNYFQLNPSGPMMVESLPKDFNYFAFTDDLLENTQTRQLLEFLSDRRIAKERLSRGFLIGDDTDKGFNTSIELQMQDPNPDKYCDCYEVELFEGKQKNIPQTSELVPESVWQESQGHFCMHETDTYPLLPQSIDKIARLKMMVRYKGNSPSSLELFYGLPLSTDWNNQWFGGRKNGEGKLEILYKPALMEGHNTAIMFYQEGHKRFTARSIKKGIMEMLKVKSTLTQGLG